MVGSRGADKPQLGNRGEGREGNSSISELQFTSAKHLRKKPLQNVILERMEHKDIHWSQVFQGNRTHLSNTKVDFWFNAKLGRKKTQTRKTTRSLNGNAIAVVW